MNSIWVMWGSRTVTGRYRGMDTIFLDLSWSNPSIVDIKKYIKLCNQNNIKVVIDILCHAYSDKARTTKDIQNDILKWGYKANGIVLDYIRFKDVYELANNNFNTKKIYDIIKFANINSNRLYLTNYSWPMCYLVGQNHRKFNKYGIVIPMLYGSKPYSKKRTTLLIKIYNIFFRYTEPLLPAWNITKADLDYYKSIIKTKFGLFRWETFKKLK